MKIIRKQKRELTLYHRQNAAVHDLCEFLASLQLDLCNYEDYRIYQEKAQSPKFTLVKLESPPEYSQKNARTQWPTSLHKPVQPI